MMMELSQINMLEYITALFEEIQALKAVKEKKLTNIKRYLSLISLTTGKCG